MRNLSAAQKLFFASEVLTVATLAVFGLNDGTTVKLTNHDVDIGDFKSQFGLDIAAITLQLGGGGQTTTITVLPDKGDGGGIKYDALEGGLLDGAGVQLSYTDYSDPAFVPVVLLSGSCSEAKYGDAETLALTVNTPMGVDRPLCRDKLSQTCRADFGDYLCKIDITDMADGATVYAPVDGQSFLLERDEVTPVGYYNNGNAYFTTGANKGLGYEILTTSEADVNGRETLYLKVPLAFDVAHNDKVTLYPGCDKVITSGCTYWNNVVNFQGEPFIADQSDILPPVSDLTVKSSGIETGLPAEVNWWLTQYIKLGYNKTILFTPGNRFVTDAQTKIISIGTAGQQTTSDIFNDYMIPQDAYTAIFNLLGGTDSIVAFDGLLKPKDTTAQAALTAANFSLTLNLNSSLIICLNPSYQNNIQGALSKYFYINVQDLSPNNTQNNGGGTT